MGGCDPFGCRAYAEAEEGYRAALSLFELLGDRWSQALCLSGLTHFALVGRRYAEAIDLGEAGVAVYEELGDPWRLIRLRSYLARCATEIGDHCRAARYQRENVATALSLGQRGVAASSLVLQGQTAAALGDAPTARAYYDQALALYRELGDAHGMAAASRALAALLQ